MNKEPVYTVPDEFGTGLKSVRFRLRFRREPDEFETPLTGRIRV
jgi:hypothetical protein